MSEVGSIAQAAVVALPPTIAALAAWRRAGRAQSAANATQGVIQNHTTVEEGTTADILGAITEFNETVLPWFRAPKPGDAVEPLPTQVRQLSERVDEHGHAIEQLQHPPE